MSNDNKKDTKSMSVLLGAAFLMATSAIGPGFLTQTSKFTAQYLASFAFVIVCVVIMDIIAQVNVWSVIGASGLRWQDIANKILPGLGVFLAIMVSIGGLAFNIGNVGGTALGMNALAGIPEKAGYILAGALGICIFLSKSGKTLVDKVAQVMGGIILVVILYVCITSKPPVGTAVMRIFTPEKPIDLFFPMITLLGGSCGGYITFSGAHRLLDAGYGGIEDVGHFRKSVLTGVGVSGTVRILLFLAVLGVCTSGAVILTDVAATIYGAGNPAAEAFRQAAGDLGYRLFGLSLFAAGTTSIIGAAYTSVSFLKTLHPFIMKNEKWFVVGFITFSTLVMFLVGNPADVLVWVGMINGLILPISLLIILVASKNKKIVGDYKHPTALIILGAVVVFLAAILGGKTIYDSVMKMFFT